MRSGADAEPDANPAATFAVRTTGDSMIDAGICPGDIAIVNDTGGIVVNLTVPSVNTGTALGDTYLSIEGVIGGTGNDTISGDGGANILYGRDGDDNLFGAGGNDVLVGGAGSDTLICGLGADTLQGGDGIDFARYDEANYGNLVIHLALPAANTGASAGDTYSLIEGVTGWTANDTIYGNALANILYGQGGADFVVGATGNNSLFGGAGSDSLSGEADADALDGGDGLDYPTSTSASRPTFDPFTAAPRRRDHRETGVGGRPTLAARAEVDIRLRPTPLVGSASLPVESGRDCVSTQALAV